jgi:preprotein translocase subunit SecG
VAHRHLLKLEALGLLEKNKYGDYMLKHKASVNGYVWVGRTLVPRLMFYSFFFMGALGSEIGIVFLSYVTGAFAVETSFIFLTAMTAVAMALFLVEAVTLGRKISHKPQKNETEKEMEENNTASSS